MPVGFDLKPAWERFKAAYVGVRQPIRGPADGAVDLLAGQSDEPLSGRLPLAMVEHRAEAADVAWAKSRERRSPADLDVIKGAVEELFLDVLEVLGPPLDEARVLLARYMPDEFISSLPTPSDAPAPRPPPELRSLFDAAVGEKGFTLRQYFKKQLDEITGKSRP